MQKNQCMRSSRNGEITTSAVCYMQHVAFTPCSFGLFAQTTHVAHARLPLCAQRHREGRGRLERGEERMRTAMR